MTRVRALIGEVFGRLTAVWRCSCSCGNTHDVLGSVLVKGLSRSCGCLRRDSTGPHKTHGMKGTKIYGIWNSMKQRCGNPNVLSYKDYGGRGIKVCRRWQRFENFYADMGDRPEGKTLERRDNDADYGPENCYWAAKEVQVKNKRNNHFITANGETLILAEWARRLGCNPAAILMRLAKGMDEVEAVTKPIPSRPNSKLSDEDVRFIRREYPNFTMIALAAKLGVSKKTVHNVLHGRIFTDV